MPPEDNQQGATDPNQQQDAGQQQQQQGGGEGGGGGQQQQQTDLIAGKYKDEDAFHAAFESLAKHDKVNLPGLASAKFDDINQKVEAYKGLESLLHRGAPKADGLNLNGEGQPDGQQANAEPAKPMSMQDLVAGVGADQEKINQAVMQGQQVPDDMLSKFAQAKITLPDGTTGTLSPDLVKQVLGAQTQAAQSQQQAMQAAAQHVGGEDKLNALLHFGRTSLPDATKRSIDLELADPSTRTAALDRLNQLYAKSVGAENSNSIVSDTAGSSGSLANKPFQTRAEMKEFAKKHGKDSDVYKSRFMATPDKIISEIA